MGGLYNSLINQILFHIIHSIPTKTNIDSLKHSFWSLFLSISLSHYTCPSPSIRFVYVCNYKHIQTLNYHDSLSLISGCHFTLLLFSVYTIFWMIILHARTKLTRIFMFKNINTMNLKLSDTPYACVHCCVVLCYSTEKKDRKTKSEEK